MLLLLVPLAMLLLDSDEVRPVVSVGAVIAQIDVSADAMAFAPDGRRLYVSDVVVENTVAVVDVATHAVTTTMSVPGQPGELTVSPDGRFVYVVIPDGLAVLDTGSSGPAALVTVGADPRDVAVSPEGRRVYVAVRGGLAVVDSRSLDLVATVGAVGEEPGDVVVSPDGRRVYVADLDAESVATVDADILAVIGAPQPLVGLVHITLSPDGRQLYWTSDTFVWALSVLDTSTGVTTRDPFRIQQSPQEATISPEGRVYWLWVYDDGRSVAADKVTVTEEGHPDLYRAVELAESDARDLQMSPDGRRLYVSHGSYGTISVIELHA